MPTDWPYWLYTFQDSFWKEVLTNQKGTHFPTIYESVLLVALSSYGEGPGDEGFRQEVHRRLRGPPSMSAEEQVWVRVPPHRSLPDHASLRIFVFSFPILPLTSPLLSPPTPTHTHMCTQLRINSSLGCLVKSAPQDHRGGQRLLGKRPGGFWSQLPGLPS